MTKYKRDTKKISLFSSEYVGPLASGLNRRAFLKASGASALLVSLAACKPEPSKLEQSVSFKPGEFTQDQAKTLQAVQLQLFPNDGDGPSAEDLNALAYLKWALTDTDNIEDGDQKFIIQGIGWLNDLAEQTKGSEFIQLDLRQQKEVLVQVAKSREGENWMSLLVYYLMEALCLDPVYGGNPEGIGWQWLAHQPGFPRPQSLTRGYRYYE